ncbi:PTS sugar transporter subunit IIA [Treponema denticola]|uniref:Excisionase family DNA binding domain-containing protein n=1 Tax=Treponema denticola H1-T TaxID=999431 RepID=M2C525_TREDN|nr:PTS sugar transporter subunit IIA [Treponema denticola]EMB27868.1 excisionase family DNA binding domain-containing protein [Treponema denticola MYR-T]EMB28753.1 excisionase family DNA binding domain-containing protein [Treponema denticola H1-T]EMB46462.1 excisionase family DNA binding domain-containing protein [Treponema denticola AL-2]UTC85547.1 PTS transporter subunit EIIA [Treponema denticola]UTC95638.1 PTS transporter subunit EIIA [Treponema denticola]
MSSEILTIEEVARYLRVSERTVYEWAQKGEIPAGKIGTVWRFKKDDIESWVDERLASSKTSVPKQHKIVTENFLSPDRVVLLDYASKHDVLVMMSEVLAKAPQVKNSAELLDAILKREALMSTAVGRGIAIPHVRLSSVTDLVMAVGISKRDILDFDAVDGNPVRLVFMIAAANNQHDYYLQTISHFSAKLRNEELKSSLLNSTDPAEVYALLCE